MYGIIEMETTEPMGSRLKRLRSERKMTLTQVSKMSGVSVSSLSKIENDQVSPSFDLIKKICDGLNIAIEDIVRSGASQRVSGRKTTTKLGETTHFTSGQYDYFAHATELSRKTMVPLEMRVRARKISEFDHWSQHNGEEFVYVLSGEIEIHTEHYTPFTLKPGESAYFDSGMKHLYISTGERDAHILSVSCDPGDKREFSLHEKS